MANSDQNQNKQSKISKDTIFPEEDLFVPNREHMEKDISVLASELDVRQIKGVVKWYDLEKGYGFISPEDSSFGDVLLHVSVIRGSGYHTIYEGSVVIADIVQGPRGLQAIRLINMNVEDAIVPQKSFRNQTEPVEPTSDWELAMCEWFSRMKGRGVLTRGEGTEDIYIDIDVLRKFCFAELLPGQQVYVRFGNSSNGLVAAELKPIGSGFDEYHIDFKKSKDVENDEEINKEEESFALPTDLDIDEDDDVILNLKDSNLEKVRALLKHLCYRQADGLVGQYRDGEEIASEASVSVNVELINYFPAIRELRSKYGIDKVEIEIYKSHNEVLFFYCKTIDMSIHASNRREYEKLAHLNNLKFVWTELVKSKKELKEKDIESITAALSVAEDYVKALKAQKKLALREQDVAFAFIPTPQGKAGRKARPSEELQEFVRQDRKALSSQDKKKYDSYRRELSRRKRIYEKSINSNDYG